MAETHGTAYGKKNEYGAPGLYRTRFPPLWVCIFVALLLRKNKDVKYLACNTVLIFGHSGAREHSNKRSKTRLKTESETGGDAKNTPHTPYGRRKTRTLRARRTLTPRFTDFKKKETRLFYSPSISQFATLLLSYHVTCHLTPSPPTPLLFRSSYYFAYSPREPGHKQPWKSLCLVGCCPECV